MYCILTYVFLHQHRTSKRSRADKENELNVDNEEDKSPPSRKKAKRQVASHMSLRLHSLRAEIVNILR